jgi:hypothetical protein
MDPEDRAEIGEMLGWHVSMKVKVIALSGAFLLVVALGLWASSPLVARCLEAVQDHFGLFRDGDPPGNGVEDTGPEDEEIEPRGTSEGQPTRVECKTLFLEEYDDGQHQVAWLMQDEASYTIQDGYAFLRLSDKVESDRSAVMTMYGSLDAVTGNRGRWLYTSLEMRLKCSDDNKINSDIGGGLRYWGLAEAFSRPDNYAWFSSWSPEAGPLVGFHTDVDVETTRVYTQDISQIDMTEWHTYTILWEPDRVEFLVDGQTVGSTDQSPSVPMFPVFTVWNLIGLEEPLPMIDLEHNISLQIDYLKCFAPAERYETWAQEVPQMISQADQVIQELEEKGFPCPEQKEILDLAQDNWIEGNYNYAAVKRHVDQILESQGSFLDILVQFGSEVDEMFSQARFCIETLKAEGKTREATIATAELSRADKYWREDMDYESTCTSLNKVTVQCPELGVLSVMGLALLSTLLHRLRECGP